MLWIMSGTFKFSQSSPGGSLIIEKKNKCDVIRWNKSYVGHYQILDCNLFGKPISKPINPHENQTFGSEDANNFVQLKQ